MGYCYHRVILLAPPLGCAGQLGALRAAGRAGHGFLRGQCYVDKAAHSESATCTRANAARRQPAGAHLRGLALPQHERAHEDASVCATPSATGWPLTSNPAAPYYRVKREAGGNRLAVRARGAITYIIDAARQRSAWRPATTV